MDLEKIEQTVKDACAGRYPDHELQLIEVDGSLWVHLSKDGFSHRRMYTGDESMSVVVEMLALLIAKDERVVARRTLTSRPKETRTPEQIAAEDYPYSTGMKFTVNLEWSIIYYSACGVVAGIVSECIIFGAIFMAVHDNAGKCLMMIAMSDIRRIEPCTQAEAEAKSVVIAESNKRLGDILKRQR